MNWKIYFQNHCTPALNVADFLAVIGEGGKCRRKNIFFSRPCKMASIVAVIGEGIIKKYFFPPEKVGHPRIFCPLER